MKKNLFVALPTAYADYAAAYYQLKNAYQNIWEENAQKFYNKPFEQLNTTQNSLIKTITPYVLSEIDQ